jgi:hypothetical protein
MRRTPSPTLTALSAAAGLLAAVVAAPAEARRGGSSDYQDSLVNDTVRNPRLIEPGGEETRYRAYYGGAGYDDRVRAEQGYPHTSRGRIRVRPSGR